jgi:hypothetical protein
MIEGAQSSPEWRLGIHQGEGEVLLSWRLLGTDPEGVGFHVDRVRGDGQLMRLTAEPLMKVTHFVDSAADLSEGTAYLIRSRVTLMHGPVYRLSICWQNVAYNQPAHTGFYLGDGMSEPKSAEVATPEK